MAVDRPAQVAVVIPARDAAEFIVDALDSVLAQTASLGEIVVVDDGSTDETARIVADYGNGVRLLRQAPSGLPAARNAGVAATSAEMVAFLDADDVWRPECVQRLRERCEANPSVGLVQCAVIVVDPELRPIHTLPHGVAGDPREAMLLPSVDRLYGGASGSLATRRAFDAVGGFDESMTHSEDWDFCYRVGAHSETDFVPEPLVLCRVHGGNMQRNVDAMRCNMLYAFDKAFADPDPQIQALRRRAYAMLHRKIAGSYLQYGRYGKAVGHLARAVVLHPPELFYALRLPQRAMARRRNGSSF